MATGEACQNRVMFKQFLMSGAMQFCQVFSVIQVSNACRCILLNPILAYSVTESHAKKFVILDRLCEDERPE